MESYHRSWTKFTKMLIDLSVLYCMCGYKFRSQCPKAMDFFSLVPVQDITVETFYYNTPAHLKSVTTTWLTQIRIYSSWKYTLFCGSVSVCTHKKTWRRSTWEIKNPDQADFLNIAFSQSSLFGLNTIAHPSTTKTGRTKWPMYRGCRLLRNSGTRD